MDDRLRRIERDGDSATVLRARMRAGVVDMDTVTVLAWAGHRDSRRVLECRCCHGTGTMPPPPPVCLACGGKGWGSPRTDNGPRLKKPDDLHEWVQGFPKLFARLRNTVEPRPERWWSTLIAYKVAVECLRYYQCQGCYLNEENNAIDKIVLEQTDDWSDTAAQLDRPESLEPLTNAEWAEGTVAEQPCTCDEPRTLLEQVSRWLKAPTRNNARGGDVIAGFQPPWASAPYSLMVTSATTAAQTDSFVASATRGLSGPHQSIQHDLLLCMNSALGCIGAREEEEWAIKKIKEITVDALTELLLRRIP